jgi:hypothetical protein
MEMSDQLYVPGALDRNWCECNDKEESCNIAPRYGVPVVQPVPVSTHCYGYDISTIQHYGGVRAWIQSTKPAHLVPTSFHVFHSDVTDDALETESWKYKCNIQCEGNPSMKSKFKLVFVLFYSVLVFLCVICWRSWTGYSLQSRRHIT